MDNARHLCVLLLACYLTRCTAALGPYTHSFTNEEKAAQRVRGAELMLDIKNAIQTGVSYFKIPAGDYRYSGPSPFTAGHFLLANATNMVIEATNVTMWFQAPFGFFGTNCTNVTVNDLIVGMFVSTVSVQLTQFSDYDPLPFTQGRILKISTANKTITVQLDEGYPLLDNNRIWTFHKKTAIQKVGVGVLNKIILIFDRAFWPTTQYTFGYLSRNFGEFPMIVNMVSEQQPVPILMVLVGGTQAVELERQSKEAVTQRIMKILRDCFDENATEPAAVHITRWLSEPFARGSFSYVSVGTTSQHFHTLATPAHERVLFAGEHTTKHFFGTVHGAYLSGIREAARLLGNRELFVLGTTGPRKEAAFLQKIIVGAVVLFIVFLNYTRRRKRAGGSDGGKQDILLTDR